MKARMIVDKAPFIAADGTMYTGAKTSRVFGIDVDSGRVLHDSHSSDLQSSLATMQHEAIGSTDSPMNPPLWLGRIDYVVRAYDADTGLEKVLCVIIILHGISMKAVVDRPSSDRN